MIILKGMRPLDTVSNIGMKVPITKAEMTQECVRKIMEEMKKVGDTRGALHPILFVSPFERFTQCFGDLYVESETRNAQKELCKGGQRLFDGKLYS